MLPPFALIEIMGGGTLLAVKAIKTLATAVNISDKTIKAVKKYNAANKGNCKGGKI